MPFPYQPYNQRFPGNLNAAASQSLLMLLVILVILAALLAFFPWLTGYALIWVVGHWAPLPAPLTYFQTWCLGFVVNVTLKSHSYSKKE